MARKKIDLPEDLTAGYAVPEDATAEDIAALIENAREQANAFVADGAKGSTAERVSKAEWYIGAIDALQNRGTELAAEAQAEADTLASLRDRIGTPAEGEVDPNETPEAKAERERKEAEAVTTPDAAATEAAATVDSGMPALVASVAAALEAQAKPTSGIAAAARFARPPRVARTAETAEAYLTAAAGAANFTAGETIDWDGAGTAAKSRFDHLPDRPGGARSSQHIASLHIPTTDTALVASAGKSGEPYTNIDEQIAWALSPERLRQATGLKVEHDLTSLVAAGGWCAPSETLYDLLDMTTAEGLIDVPGITVNRGGVRYSLGPDFTAIYNAGFNFTRTEAQTIAGLAKPVVNIPCPTFNEYRMLVDGMYLTGDILSSKGYPEAYADFTQKALKAFQHYVSAATIQDMVTASTAVDFTVGATKYGTQAVTTELLGAIELQITDMRYRNRLSLQNSVEIVLPLWIKGALRSDLAKRTGYENALDLSDATIEGWFTDRNANVQFVYDWQDAFTGTPAGFGSATPILGWPTSAQFLIYPTGTFVRALNEVIELSAVYDSVLLKTNQYVALFMEQARLTLKRGWDARVCTIPVGVTGATGAAKDYTATDANRGALV